MYMCAYTCTYVHMYTCTCVYVYNYVYVRVYVYIICTWLVAFYLRDVKIYLHLISFPIPHNTVCFEMILVLIADSMFFFHNTCACPQQGSLQWRRELAALIIQLAWRQYLRRKLLRQSLRRQRVLHDWTPSVLAARQRALVEKIYGESDHQIHDIIAYSLHQLFAHFLSQNTIIFILHNHTNVTFHCYRSRADGCPV